MAKTTITVGAVLVAVGVVGWLASGFASWTALIPAIIGVVIAALGWLGLTKPLIGVHAALVVALVGLAGTARMVVGMFDAGVTLAETSGTITFVVLLVYVVMGVRSFVAVRRGRSASSVS